MIPARSHTDAESARRCVNGELVAEELTTTARGLVVAWLHARGLPDTEIARRARMSTYTAFRIRSRLGLRAHTTDFPRSNARGA
ncbi:DNA-binding NarL/FixJ family response regulator [Actinokineospora baliensis]|nr:DNA-binding NarL/FixJ family response regulator [Actinokineospora baliensis]